MNTSARIQPTPKRPERPAPRQPSRPPDRPRPDPSGDDEEPARRPRRENVKGVKDVDALTPKARNRPCS